ncbi:hypothetical protein [Brevibacillus reuszeri]|uniref:hypothetical protein n=1 Tax=Brevibacillus reuszeri TaxID=54915 RepID=UPI003D2548AF
MKSLIDNDKLQEARELVTKSPDYQSKNYVHVLHYIDSLNYASQQKIEQTDRQLQLISNTYSGPLVDDIKQFKETWIVMKEEIIKEQQDLAKQSEQAESKAAEAIVKFIKSKQYDNAKEFLFEKDTLLRNKLAERFPTHTCYPDVYFLYWPMVHWLRYACIY